MLRAVIAIDLRQMNASRQPLIDLVYFNAGGGHKASAEAL
jgi:hypothetical protein